MVQVREEPSAVPVVEASVSHEAVDLDLPAVVDLVLLVVPVVAEGFLQVVPVAVDLQVVPVVAVVSPLVAHLHLRHSWMD